MTDEFSVESVYAELLGRAPENKMEPRLAPLFRAMDVLGEPNKAFPIIHVTGTNGKTSTARMIESVLRAHGLSTGRYTSPHLSKVTERISIDGHPVSDETFVRIWDEIRPYLQIVDSELEADGQAMKDPPMLILPNLRLMDMEKQVASLSRDLRFKVTGLITEYNGRNYILLDKAVVVSDVTTPAGVGK